METGNAVFELWLVFYQPMAGALGRGLGSRLPSWKERISRARAIPHWLPVSIPCTNRFTENHYQGGLPGVTFAGVSTNRLSIDAFLPGAGHHLLLDVRSPGEYRHAHMPGAVSLPLFSDEERAVVGTTYKQQSRELAIKVGLDYFGPKMRGVVEKVEELLGVRYRTSAVGGGMPEVRGSSLKPEIYVYCWRGGMRSGAVAWLLGLYGFKVQVLQGGYKAYRNHVLQTLARPFRLRVLGGYTGSGKTELLGELARKGEAVVDLEGLASHKGSAFGSAGLPPQPTQEMFENLLAGALLSHDPGRDIWIEDESQRIGTVNIPAAFWDTMRSSPIYFLDIPFEERLRHIVEEYGCLDRDYLAGGIGRISKRLGGLEARNALAYLEEGRLEACFSILLKYYDKRYSKGLHNREDLASLLLTIACATVSPDNVNLLTPNPATA